MVVAEGVTTIEEELLLVLQVYVFAPPPVTVADWPEQIVIEEAVTATVLIVMATVVVPEQPDAAPVTV